MREFSVRKISGQETIREQDLVAVEEPLAIRIGYWVKDSYRTEHLAVTMRTPGADRELAIGFLYSEQLIQSTKDVIDTRFIGTLPANEIMVDLPKHVDVDAWRAQRLSFVNSACGICGSRHLDGIPSGPEHYNESGPSISRSFVESLPRLLEGCQTGFTQTGGLHAAMLVHADGRPRAVFEDVGRHNAFDKVIGWALLQEDISLPEHLMFLSSRSSYELAAKAIVARIPVLATVGAPSSLAIEAARERGLTLIGFVRERRFNIYACEWRINSD